MTVCCYKTEASLQALKSLHFLAVPTHLLNNHQGINADGGQPEKHAVRNLMEAIDEGGSSTWHFTGLSK